MPCTCSAPSKGQTVIGQFLHPKGCDWSTLERLTGNCQIHHEKKLQYLFYLWTHIPRLLRAPCMYRSPQRGIETSSSCTICCKSISGMCEYVTKEWGISNSLTLLWIVHRDTPRMLAMVLHE